MFCAKCGAENEAGMRFCEQCGTPLDSKVVSTDGASVSRKKPVIIGIICGCVMIACIIGILVYNSSQKQAEYNEKIEAANQYYTDMDYEKAETAYLEAIEIKPKEADAYLMLSQVYTIQGRHEDAIAILEKGQQEAGGEEIENRLKQLTGQQAQFQAYYDLCMEYQQKYGAAGFYSYGTDDYGELQGLSVVRLMDFNQDGNQELLLGFGAKAGIPDAEGLRYEIWAWQDGQLVNVLPATEVNHGTDVSGWIAACENNGTLYIINDKLAEGSYWDYQYYDGKTFVVKFKGQEDAWGENTVENRYYVDGQEVSKGEYDAAFGTMRNEEPFEFYDEYQPYSNELGEFRIDFRSINSTYANNVFAETNAVLELLKTGGSQQENSGDNGEGNDAYNSIIAQYEELVANREGIADGSFAYGKDINFYAAISLDGYYGKNNIYYAFVDIDKNGTDELIIGFGEDKNSVTNCDIFALNSNEPVHLFADYGFGERTQLTIYRDGTMQADLTGGAWDNTHEYYKLSEDGCTPVLEEYISSVSSMEQDDSGDPIVVYYHDKAETDEISEAEFTDVLNSYSVRKKLKPNWMVIE